MVLSDEHQAGGAIRGGGNGATNTNTSRSGKKQKHDRVPQRGLGVAELERIRLRDQHKSTAGTGTGAPQTPCNPPSTGLIIPPPSSQLRKQHRQFPALALTPEPSSTLLKPPAIPFPSPTASLGMVNLPPRATAPATKEGGGSSLMCSPPAQGGLCWNPYSMGTPDPGFLPPVPYTSSDGLADPVWARNGYGQQQRRSPPPRHHQHKQQQQALPPPYPMMSPSISPSTSGANQLQMEPPSNQISISSNCQLLPPWPEEERIGGGVKPQWPFPFESTPLPQGNSFISCKLPPFPRPEELQSIQGLETIKFPLSNSSLIRDGSPSSTSIQEDVLRKSSTYHSRRSDKNPKDNNSSAKDESFLGPVSPLPPSPAAAANAPWNYSSSKAKQPMSSVLLPPTPTQSDHKLHQVPEIGPMHSFYAHLDYGSSPPQFTRQVQVPYYDFFPATMDVCETATTKQGGTPMEQIDLELRL